MPYILLKSVTLGSAGQTKSSAGNTMCPVQFWTYQHPEGLQTNTGRSGTCTLKTACFELASHFSHWTKAVQQVKTGNMYIGSRRWRPVQWDLSERTISTDSQATTVESCTKGVNLHPQKGKSVGLYFTEVPDTIHADYLTDRWLLDLKARMNCSVWRVLSTVLD